MLSADDSMELLHVKVGHCQVFNFDPDIVDISGFFVFSLIFRGLLMLLGFPYFAKNSRIPLGERYTCLSMIKILFMRY